MHQISITVKSTLLILAMLTLGIFPALSQAGEIMCWQNDIGIRECGNTVPPEYSQKQIEVLNDQGVVVKVIPAAKTQAELKKEAEQAQLQKEQAAAKKEQEHQDNILLNSYASERDLILSRNSNVQAARGDLDIALNNLQMQQGTLNELQNTAGNYERSGRQPPKRLIAKIDRLKRQIAAQKKSIAIREKSINAMKQRFDKDLARYRKLKGLKH